MARLERLETYVRLLVEPQDRILEIGRQTGEDPPPLSVVVTPSHTRLVIASREQNEIGRHQLRIEILNNRQARLTNINKNNFLLPTGVDLKPGESVNSPLPMRLNRGGLQLSIEIAGAERNPLPVVDDVFESLAVSPQPPQTMISRSKRELGSVPSPQPVSESFVSSIQRPDPNAMLDRLGRLVTVLQQAASTADFAKEIALTVVEMVNLDRAAVLLLDGDDWKTEAFADHENGVVSQNWRPSQRLLSQLLRDRKTIWGKPGAAWASASESMTFVLAMVAAPILNAAGELIGAVYGDRRIGGSSSRPPIDQFDAKLVEILACGVAGGWARAEQEQAAVARRIQFERFVTKEVARNLEEDSDALRGRDADVTLLFCDIEGFSRISGLLTPKQTFEWINAVMEALSQCVFATKGTLVDYIGDELIAMWGAPYSHENHAVAATEAAYLMMDAMRSLNQRYRLPSNEITQVGIGLNSGPVQVGNTGSELKLKYGPLGSHVNIASRVQGATRFLRTRALITGNTAGLLKGAFRTRRLCSVRLKNINEPVELFELVENPDPDWTEFAADYEKALVAWEKRELRTTIEILSQLVARNSNDGPTMVLLSRAIDFWSRDYLQYDPVWTLASK